MSFQPPALPWPSSKEFLAQMSTSASASVANRTDMVANMGTVSVELDRILTRRRSLTEFGKVQGDDGSIVEQLQRVASPGKKRRAEVSQIQALVNKNMNLQQELERQQKKHEEELQMLKQQTQERDEETQKQFDNLQRTLESMQARFEYDLHFDMLNDMPRDKAVKVCELIESLENERSQIKLYRVREGERNSADHLTSTPVSTGLRRSDSFHLIGSTPERPDPSIAPFPIEGTGGCTPAGSDASTDADIQDQKFPLGLAIESMALMEFSDDEDDDAESDDDDGAGTKRKLAFKLSFYQEAFPTLIVSALPGRDANLKDVLKLSRAITQVLDRTDITEFVAIYDIRDLIAPPTPVVLEIANWCRVNEHRFRRRLRAAAIIMADSFWTKAVEACVWAVTCIAPPVCPFKMVSSVEHAESFLRVQVEALEERKQLKEAKKERKKEYREERHKAGTGGTAELEAEDDDNPSSVGGPWRRVGRSPNGTPVATPRGTPAATPRRSLASVSSSPNR